MFLTSSQFSLAGAVTEVRTGQLEIELLFQAPTDQTGCGAGQICYSVAPGDLSPVSFRCVKLTTQLHLVFLWRRNFLLNFSTPCI
jgi:hypothetical protein